jgi:type II secretory pathway pseudopilin PulG
MTQNLKIKMQKSKLKKQQGFSILEIILYVGMVSVMMLAVGITITLVYRTQLKNRSVIEVEQQGEFIMQTVTQVLRNATSITSPTAHNFSTSLTIVDASSTKVFDTHTVSGATVFEITDGGIPTDLTSTKVNVTNLKVYNLTRTNNTGVIRFTYTVSYNGGNNRNELSYTRNFYGTAVLRP